MFQGTSRNVVSVTAEELVDGKRAWATEDERGKGSEVEQVLLHSREARIEVLPP
jgi:hypothetical protein